MAISFFSFVNLPRARDVEPRLLVQPFHDFRGTLDREFTRRTVLFLVVVQGIIVERLDGPHDAHIESEHDCMRGIETALPIVGEQFSFLVSHELDETEREAFEFGIEVEPAPTPFPDSFHGVVEVNRTDVGLVTLGDLELVDETVFQILLEPAVSVLVTKDLEHICLLVCGFQQVSSMSRYNITTF